MIIRKESDLKLTESLSKAESNVYEEEKIGIVYVPERGYILNRTINDKWNNVFIVKTRTKPEEYVTETLKPYLENNKKEFIKILETLLLDIYKNVNIKEYEKKHQEFIFLELFDKLNENDVEKITPEDPVYEYIDDLFNRLEINHLKNFAKSTNSKLRALFNYKPQDVNASNALNEKLKKFKEY